MALFVISLTERCHFSNFGSRKNSGAIKQVGNGSINEKTKISQWAENKTLETIACVP